MQTRALFRILVACAAVAAAAAAAEGNMGNVLTLNTDNFDQAVKDNSFLVVEFFAPWCGHCKRLAPEWDKAATTLKGDTSAGQAIVLAAVDVTVERSLGEKFDIKGFPTIKIFEGHSLEATEYQGPRNADGIVDYLKKRASPASIELTSAKEVPEIKKSEPIIVVNAGPVTETWTKVSEKMRGVVYFCHSTDKAVLKAFGVKAGTITMIKDFDDKEPVYSGDASDADKIREFIDLHRVPVAALLKKGDQNTLKNLFEDDNKPNVFLFTDGQDTGADGFKTAVFDLRGKVVSVRIHADDFPEAFNHFGVPTEGLPKVLIEDKSTSLKYISKGPVTEESIKAFLADWKDGKLEPFLKSQPEPADNSGPVKVIVGSSFDKNVRQAGHFVFLEAYAPWCGHCKKLAPIWDDLGMAFADSSGSSKVVIAKIDATENDLPKALKVEGFPTLMLFKGDGTAPKKHEGGRDFKSLSKYVEAETGAKVKAGFVPSTPPEPEDESNWEDIAVQFFKNKFEVPFMQGTLVSGLLLAAVVIFLLFVAAICLVIACMPLPKPEKYEKKD